jgi:cytochrome c oxidase subunit III
MVGWLRPPTPEDERHERPDRVLDLRKLPAHPTGIDAPEWWGIVGLVVIEAIVFTGAMASYFHLKVVNDAWPPAFIGEPDLLLPTLNTFLLLLSTIPGLARRAGHEAGQRPDRPLGLPIAMGMLVVFLGLKIYEYAGHDWGVSTHAYGSIVMLMTGLHMAHVGAVVLKSGVILQYLRSGRIEPRRAVPLEANAVYYYFVAGIWVPLYATIYLAPHLLP